MGFSTMKSDGTSLGPEPIDREEYLDSQRLLHARHQLSEFGRIVEAIYKRYSESKRSLLESKKKSGSSSNNSGSGANASNSAVKSGQQQGPSKDKKSGGDVKEDEKKNEKTQPKSLAPTSTQKDADSTTGEEISGVEEPK